MKYNRVIMVTGFNCQKIRITSSSTNEQKEKRGINANEI